MQQQVEMCAIKTIPRRDELKYVECSSSQKPLSSEPEPEKQQGLLT